MEKNFKPKTAALVLDVGNSNLVGSLALPGQEIRELYRVKTPSTSELEHVLDPWLSLASHASIPWMVASVVPALDAELLKISAKRSTPCAFVKADLNRSFDLKIPYPNQLGADRLANLEAVSRILAPSEAAIIVDAGTATKFCALAPEPGTQRLTYLGGLITPGLEISYDALVSRAAKLSEVPLHSPKKIIGNTTESQIQSGFFFPHAAMIEEMTDQLTAELPEFKRFRLIATGGCLNRIQLSSRFEWIPSLTLQGISAYADLKNSS